MTWLSVSQLKEKLEKLEEKGLGEYKIIAYDKGAPYNFPIGNVYEHPYDKKHDNRQITLGR